MTPKLICITPVRNEAWILDIFLKCTSLWADHIIIADQNSTDGSREIAEKYPKVILIENNTEEFNEPERQKMLIYEARKIKGPKILFALDADEIFTANFMKTKDWQQILESRPGEVFGFQWANVLPNRKSYFPSDFYYPWVVNDDGTEHKNYVREIHSMRIPYPISADLGYYKVNDFKVLHLAWIYEARANSKNRFYQCLSTLLDPNTNFVSLFRSHQRHREKILPLSWTKDYEKDTLSLFDMISFNEKIFWFDNEVIRLFVEHGIEKFKYLNIWEKKWMFQMKDKLIINDPRQFCIKPIHQYLRITKKYYPSVFLKLVDKLIKMFF